MDNIEQCFLPLTKQSFYQRNTQGLDKKSTAGIKMKLKASDSYGYDSLDVSCEHLGHFAKHRYRADENSNLQKMFLPRDTSMIWTVKPGATCELCFRTTWKSIAVSETQFQLFRSYRPNESIR